METVQDILHSSDAKMKKSLQSFSHKLATLRTGQASVSQFENIVVECYGSTQQLHQVSAISIPESRQILIKPWDSSLLPEIEKAIMRSNMSVNPNNDGKVIRIMIPPLTDQTREESIKSARELAEEARVSIRNIRRDTNEKIKKMKNSGDISEDEMKGYEKQVQDMTDAVSDSIDSELRVKEKTIREI